MNVKDNINTIKSEYVPQTLIGALDYIRIMRVSEDEEEIIDAFHKSVQALGFNGVTIIFGVKIKDNNITAKHYFDTLPEVWREYYSGNKLLAKDPVIKWNLEGGYPARWQDIRKIENDPDGVFTKAEKHGFPDGVTLPFYLTSELTILNGLCTREVDPTTYSVFCHIARFAAVKLHFCMNGLDMLYLGDERIKPMDLKIVSMKHSNIEINEIAKSLNVTPNTIQNRLNKLMELTGTDAKNGPAQVLQAIGII